MATFWCLQTENKRLIPKDVLLQMKERALEVWETEEAIEEARDRRMENKQKVKLKKFDKKMKGLNLNFMI